MILDSSDKSRQRLTLSCEVSAVLRELAISWGSDPTQVVSILLIKNHLQAQAEKQGLRLHQLIADLGQAELIRIYGRSVNGFLIKFLM